MRGRRSPTASPAGASRAPASEPRWLRYDEAGRFGTYVERFFDVIGRERCFISLFDDLVADPEGAISRDVRLRRARARSRAPTSRRAARAAGSATAGSSACSSARRASRATISRARNSPSASAASTRRPRDDKVTEKIFSVRKRLLRWNRIPLPKRPIPVAVQADIRARLKPEIDRLATLLGRDLSHWLEVREGRLG